MGSPTIYCKHCEWEHDPSGIIDGARAVWRHYSECNGGG